MTLPKAPFVVLDTETTGLLPKVNRVIEFASVRCEDGKIVDEYEQLISVPVEVPDTVQVITRIRPDDLTGKPTFDDVRDEITRRIGTDTIIIGQNVGFDIAMLKGEGIDLSDRPWIDTSMLASLVYPELRSYSLGYVSTVLGLNHAPVHRALGDVHATLELLEKCWERLTELPDELADVAKAIMAKSCPGYQILFEELETKGDSAPAWLTMQPDSYDSSGKSPLPSDAISVPPIGTVHLLEEPLHAATLNEIIARAKADTDHVQWIAVKNLEAVLRRTDLDDDVRVLYPPFLILDHEAATELAAQSSYTADEATLATKLAWYEPHFHGEIPIHGDEKRSWNAKLACTDTSTEYLDQFKDLPSVILLDHRQLLAFLADSNHAAHSALNENAHIIIDDASMLEDTATKAYGWYCNLDDIRAGAQGDSELTSFTDVLQIWIERVRNNQDTYYITQRDLHEPEVKGLKERLDHALSATSVPRPIQRQFSDLTKILDPNNVDGRIIWIEQRQDGCQFIQSAPEYVSTLLAETLYEKFPTTLLIPTGSDDTLTEIIPEKTTRESIELPEGANAILPLECNPDITLTELLDDPPDGKSIVLLSSRRLINEYFVSHTEKLEQRGVTLICQGFSGGQNRTQAEFTAAASPCVWLMTPWMYETIELDTNLVDQLVIQSVPFDIPTHPVFQKRGTHYANAFEHYSLTRLMHRLFRLLRTFCRHNTKNAEVLVLDERLKTKSYGAKVVQYMGQFMREDPPSKRGDNSDQMSLFSK